MIIGYARTSTVEQQAGLEAQGRDLLAAGVCQGQGRGPLQGPQAHGAGQDGRCAAASWRGPDLRMEAELNMELSSARDLYSVIKHSGPPDAAFREKDDRA